MSKSFAVVADDVLSNNPKLLAAVVASTALGVAWGVMKLCQRPQNSRKGVRRTFSFTSAAMGMGAFPPDRNMPEPLINVAILFDDCPSVEDVAKQVVVPLLQYERLSTIPLPFQQSSRPCVEVLDPVNLVRRIVIDGDDQDLYDAIRKRLHDPLSCGRGDYPWWEILIIDNQGKGKSSCLWRIHHCLADGISMMSLVEEVIKNTDGSPLSSFLPSGMAKKFQSKSIFSFFKRCIGVLTCGVKVLTMPYTAYDDDTVFSRSLNAEMVNNRNRDLVLFHPIPLDFVKAIKTAAKVTVNDVLYACVSDAVHQYLMNEDCHVLKEKGSRLQCRCLMPVALPRLQTELRDRATALRNKWCLVSTDLGVQVADTRERLDFVHRHLDDIKFSPCAFVTLAIQETIPPFLPVSVGRKVLFDTMSRHSLVLTNVPGPSQPCMFGGKEATGVQMFFPNLIPQISFVSYRGTVFGNICVDPVGIPNCQSLSVFFSRAMVRLARRLEVDVPLEVAAHAQASCSKTQKEP